MTSISTRVKAGLADQQVRAGFELVSGSAFNAIAGLGFWFIAARSFDESIVGLNAAAISTLGLVESFATLGMKNVLIRFMPRGALESRGFVRRTYAATSLAALVLAPIIAFVVGRRLDQFSILTSLTGIAGFTIACMIWVIFVLQDSVLVAIRRTTLIPISNLVYAVAKLMTLFVLALGSFRWGIFAAWVAPLAVIVVWVNIVAFRTMRDLEDDRDAPPTGLARFAAGEFASTVVNMGLFGLFPIFVLAQLGERASAFYALAFTIAYNLMLASSNVSTALLAAAAHEDGKLFEQTGKALRQMAILVIPAAVLVAAFAPIGLRLFGSSYSTEGSSLLRLLALTAVANIPVAAAIGVLRSERQVGRLVGLYTIRSALIFGLCVALSSSFGLTGLGFGWLVGETIMAIGLSLGVLRPNMVDLLRRPAQDSS